MTEYQSLFLLWSRPAWGAWIETSTRLFPSFERTCRAPHGARGLKQSGKISRKGASVSRPAWGAWIETLNDAQKADFWKSRPAWGAWIETDLYSPEKSIQESRPAWGAWIETSQTLTMNITLTSRPAWGAWIETRGITFPPFSVFGRAPHGARGLKQSLLVRECQSLCVAPRMGRVD